MNDENKRKLINYIKDNFSEVYRPAFEHSFKKHYRRVIRGGRYKPIDFSLVYYLLLYNLSLDARYNDNKLDNYKSNLSNRELHVKPDWLLIYRYHYKYIMFVDTGSHSDLFK